jgi:hypothetical protein
MLLNTDLFIFKTFLNILIVYELAILIEKMQPESSFKNPTIELKCIDTTIIRY